MNPTPTPTKPESETPGSPTPRTDAAITWLPYPELTYDAQAYTKVSDLCEQLEKETASLTASRDAALAEIERVKEQRTDMTIEASRYAQLAAEVAMKASAAIHENATLRADLAASQDEARQLRHLVKRVITRTRKRDQELKDSQRREGVLRAFALNQYRQHSMDCEFPEGCSCGAKRHNATIDKITALATGSEV